jgi:hypothetical protein
MLAKQRRLEMSPAPLVIEPAPESIDISEAAHFSPLHVSPNTPQLT